MQWLGKGAPDLAPESSMTTTSSTLNIAAVRAIWPATAVACSRVWQLSMTEPGSAMDIVDCCAAAGDLHDTTDGQLAASYRTRLGCSGQQLTFHVKSFAASFSSSSRVPKSRLAWPY